MALLEVIDLKTEYTTSRGTLRAVDGVSFTLNEGEALGVVGESGCGKSTIMKSLLRLLPQGARIVGGQIRFQGKDLVPMSQEEMRKLRWQQIALITQSAMNALNPVYKVGDQIVEVLKVHAAMPKKAAWARAGELFETVGLDAKRLNDYPHQLSGGMRQRAMIAMALALNPKLIIADEPTTALDVVIQDRILRRISELQAELNIAMVFVTHDISLVAQMCQKAMVMYAGKVVELGSARHIFKEAYHPYTLGLLNAFPSIKADTEELVSIPGYPPDLTDPPTGCRFAARCPFATAQCHAEDPAIEEVAPGHLVACHYTEKVEEFREKASHRATWEGVAS